MFGITITGIAVLLILTFFFILGAKLGFLRAVFDLIKFFFSGIMAWVLYPVVAGILSKTPLYGFIKKTIVLTIDGNINLDESLPEFFVNLPSFFKNSILDTSKQTGEALIATVADALTILAINAISIILIFIVVRFLTAFLKKLTVKLNKVFIIGPVNKALGAVFGLIQGYFVVCLILLIISMFPTGGLYKRVHSDYEKSPVVKIIINEKTDIFGLNARYSESKGEKI